MVDTDYPNIASFIIRFTHDQPGSETGLISYRGLIRHIQTDQEIAFTRWIDAVDFINSVLPWDIAIDSVPSNNSDHQGELEG